MARQKQRISEVRFSQESLEDVIGLASTDNDVIAKIIGLLKQITPTLDLSSNSDTVQYIAKECGISIGEVSRILRVVLAFSNFSKPDFTNIVYVADFQRVLEIVNLSANEKSDILLQIVQNFSVDEEKKIDILLQVLKHFSVTYEPIQLLVLKILEEKYEIQNPSPVAAFLCEHTELIGFLINEAYLEIRKRFPHEKLILELFFDSGDSQELFLDILTSLSAEEGLKKIDELDEQWFLDQTDKINGLFNYSIRYI